MLPIVVLAAWFAADFVCGVVHWFEDRYLDDSMTLKFLQPINGENSLHHLKPTAMLTHSWWGNMQSAAIVAWPLAVVLWLAGDCLFFVLTVFFASFGNLVHRFAHTPARQLPRWVRWVQSTGLFISHAHHDMHHRHRSKLIPKSQASIAYCPMTDWVNPTLDRFNFWAGLERIFSIFGLVPTVDRITQPFKGSRSV
jgi:plasmanylethanolamine desaturase